jgi:hypothetical protein
MTTTRHATLLCDSRIVTGQVHRLGTGYYRVTTPEGDVYRLCSPGCLAMLATQPGALWGWAPSATTSYSPTGAA